jgi:saccharopepsin
LKKHSTGQPDLQNGVRNLQETNGSLDIQRRGRFSTLLTVQVTLDNIDFNLILDTGSDILWVPSSYLSDDFNNTYDCSMSSTCIYHDEEYLSIEYGSGDVEGYMITDQLHIGGFTLKKFNMLLIDYAYFSNTSDFDGILGLSLRTSEDGYSTLLDSLKKEGLIRERTFSMYLGTGLGSDQEIPGELIFGGYDPKYADSEFQFVEVSRKTNLEHWTSMLTGIGYGPDETLSFPNDSPVVFDSGASGLVLPRVFINRIIKELNEKDLYLGYIESRDRHNCKCEAIDVLEDLIFYFDSLYDDGPSFNIPASDYIQHYDETFCFFVLSAMEDFRFTVPVILGDVFLQRYYALYSADNSTIGFARAKSVTVKPHSKNLETNSSSEDKKTEDKKVEEKKAEEKKAEEKKVESSSEYKEVKPSSNSTEIHSSSKLVEENPSSNSVWLLLIIAILLAIIFKLLSKNITKKQDGIEAKPLSEENQKESIIIEQSDQEGLRNADMQPMQKGLYEAANDKEETEKTNDEISP